MFFLYRKLIITINKFKIKDTEFAKIIIQSFILKPYQIHKARPVNNVASIHIEISEAFFSFINFNNCGKREIPVKILATIPIIVVLFKTLILFCNNFTPFIPSFFKFNPGITLLNKIHASFSGSVNQ